MKIQLINLTIRDLVAGYRDGEGSEMSADTLCVSVPL